VTFTSRIVTVLESRSVVTRAVNQAAPNVGAAAWDGLRIPPPAR